ncbi:MAG: hypothetical protein FJW27_19890 [Acidimicrobiia bacterium]|nr:hypothetical protein [Acidimicrobiia bacterium]
MSVSSDLRLLVACNGDGVTAVVHHAITQLSSTCAVELTVARLDNGDDNDDPTTEPLAFDAERSPRRIQRLAFDRPDAIAQVCARQAFDLVMTPSADASWRPWRRSFRSRLLPLLSRAAVPVWTAGYRLPALHFHRPIRTVACLLDFGTHPKLVLARAASFARHLGARLHVLSVLPSIDESTLATALTPDAPLLPAAAVARVEQMYTGTLPPVVEVVVDTQRHGTKRLLAACQPDLLFVNAPEAAWPWPFGLASTLDRLECPVVRVPVGAALGDWSFERAWSARSPAPSYVSVIGNVRVGPWPADSSTSRTR